MDAIEYFKGMRKRLCEDHLKLLPQKSVGYQATLREMSFYDVAIEALEQQPCTDAISRKAVEDAIYDYSRSCDVDYEQIMEYIDKLPSVSTEKTGRWLYTGDYITDGMLKCSKCGFEHDVSERFLYCPKCGTKMEEIEE